MGTTGIILSHQQAGIVRRILLPLIVTLSLVASQLALLGVAPAQADAAQNTLPFEIDGNATTNNPGSSIDWDTVSGAGFALDPVDSNNDVSFQSGTEANQDGWDLTRAKATPPKSDLERTFAAGGLVGGDPLLYFGYVLNDAPGGSDPSFSANMEFNQSESVRTFPVSGGSVSVPVRTPGDVLIAGEYLPNATVLSIYEWDGSTWIPRPGAGDGALSTGTVTLPAQIGGGQAPDRRFAEARVNLRQLLGQDGCASFAQAYAKTRTTGANALGGSLVDITDPIPLAIDFCGSLDVRKVTTAGGQEQGLAGATFRIQGPEGFDQTCVTGADGSCPDTFEGLEPGSYTVTEIVPPPGFRLSDPVSQTFEVAPFESASVTFDNPPITYAIDVDPEDATNAVGFTHDFEVTLTTDFIFDVDAGAVVDQSESADIPLAGETVTVSWSGEPEGSQIVAVRDADRGPITDIDGTTSTTCVTDEDGTCTIQVLSDAVGGPGTLTATYATPLSGPAATDPTTTTGGALISSISDAGDKSWIGYVVELDGDADNPLGEDHTFTATVNEVAANGDQSPAADVEVSFGWEGPEGSGIDGPATCTTGEDGTCSVTVTSPDDAGTGTLSVTSVEGDILPGETLVIAYDDEVTAAKTWWDYRVTIDGDSTNPLGEEHDFAVTIERNDGTGWSTVPDGTTIDQDDMTWVGVGEIDGTTCESPGTVDGTCTVTVTTDEVGAGTLTIDRISGATLPGYLDGAAFAYDVDAVDATKTWVDWEASISFSAENPVGEAHTFTVDASVYDDASGTYLPVPDGTIVTLDYDASAVDVDADTCATGTEDGACELTVSSDTVQVFDVTVTGIGSTTIDDGGVDRTVSFVFDGDPIASSKTWIDHRVVADDDATNLSGDDHTFTLTAQELRPDGDWTALPGVTIDVSLQDGSIGTLDAGTCDEGTDAQGECTVTVSADVAGTSTVVATGIDGVTLLDGVTETSTTTWQVDVEDVGQTKTWVTYDVALTGDAVNNVGDDHTFTVTVRVDDGTGPVAAVGADVTGVFDWTTPDLADLDVTCTIGDQGTCELIIAAPDADGPIPGQGTLTLTGVDHTYTGDEGPEADFIVALDGSSGLEADFQQPASTKTWIDYQLTVTPTDATNLLPGFEDHEFTVTLSSTDGTLAPIAGQRIELTLDSEVATLTEVVDGEVGDDGLTATCTTDDSGSCVVTARSEQPGTATLSAAFSTVIDEASFELAASGDKLWTTFVLRVTPDVAQNLLGTPHTFTVEVLQTDRDGDLVPVEGAQPTLSIPEPAFLVGGSDTCADGTDGDGRCTVQVDSPVTGFFTLTAEYQGVIGQQTAGFSDSGTKQWITYTVDVDPQEAENLTATDHVFTVTVGVDEGEGVLPVAGAVPTLDLDGVGVITSTDCDEGTGDDGTCTVTITSNEPGLSTLTATYLGTAGVGDGGQLESAEFSDQGDKLWVAYDLSVSPGEAINALDDPHTFTATLTRDTGEGPAPAAGASLELAITGPGTITSVTEGEVAEDGRSATCTTGGDGTCEVVLVSSEVGATVLTASYDAVVGETSGTFTDQGTKFWTAIDLVKTALVEADEDGLKVVTFDPDGEPTLIDYEYLITNTGPVELTVTSLEDDVLGNITLDDPVVLGPGESTTATATHTVTAADAAAGSVVNVAVVTAVAEDGTQVEAEDDETVGIQEVLAEVPGSPAIEIVKEALVDVGDDGLKVIEVPAGGTAEIVYRYTITNTGDVTITDLSLDDDVIGDLTDLLTVTELAPGASTVVEVTYTTTAADLAAGSVTNVAIVTGDTPDGPVSAEDDETVDIVEVLAQIEVQPEPEVEVAAQVESLPRTGADAWMLMALSALLAAIGAAILLFAPRRRTT